MAQGEIYNLTTSQVGKNRNSLFGDKIRKFDTQKSRMKKQESPHTDSMRKYETQVTRGSQKKKSEKYEKLIESNYFDLGESIVNEQFGIIGGPQSPCKVIDRIKTILKSISHGEEDQANVSH
jgi:hypothetical protein